MSARTCRSSDGKVVSKMKTYNCFDHDQRMKGHRWLQSEYAAGRRARPTACDACGQTLGPFDAHSEDYSEPFGDHIGRFALCYRCHMAIHTRHDNPEAWATYKLHVAVGRIFHPIGRNFGRFASENLRRKLKDVPYEQRPAPVRTFLDDLR
jgi:hypothetical protein